MGKKQDAERAICDRITIPVPRYQAPFFESKSDLQKTEIFFYKKCRMKTLSPLILLVVFLLAGCNTAEKYAANQASTDAWLSSKAGKAAIRVDGVWEALEFGWGGSGRFTQSGNRISGALGNYNVRGVVNGSTVYLAFVSGGWTYYTGVLKKRGSMLGGFYSSSIPFSSEDQGSLNLRRIAD